MKALLKYGNFTALIELPEKMYKVSVMKPQESLSLVPLTENQIADLTKAMRLDFIVRDRLTEDIWLYEFESES